MFEKLELKIIAVVVSLMLIGICIAGYMVYTIERGTLYSITDTSSEATAEIISKDVERTMLAGQAEVTKQIIGDIKGVHGVEDISVLFHTGRPAFEPNAKTVEKEMMDRIVQTKAPVHFHDVTKIMYYSPLINKDACKGCHVDAPDVLGAVKITMSIQREYDRAMKMIVLVIMVTIFGCVCFSLVLWYMIRRLVISPIKMIEDASLKLAEGDFSFDVKVRTRDEMGRLTTAIKGATQSVAGILMRIKEVSRRVSQVTEEVERESRKLVDGAAVETESITNISASIEEMNAAISEIADGTDGLAASAEETAASMEQMVASISHINSGTLELQSSVETTTASIEELSAAIKQVAGTSRELSSSSSDMQVAIEEISASVKEVEQRAKESARLSGRVKEDAVTFGMVSIEKTMKGMQDIRAAVEKTADYVRKLGGRSEEIGKILNVIDEITDQTTLLALNAAILAAQAGEHGKGFSVVADEIKELADRTSLSTQEIAQLIQSVQQEVADAVDAMGGGLRSVETGFKVTSEAADALRKIVESSTRSSEMSTAIEKATMEQTTTARHVADSMQSMTNMIDQIAKATTEQDKGIQLIMSAAQRINDYVGHVRTATNEQSLNSKQVSQAVELVSDKSQQISRAINEQKSGSNQIWTSLERIKDLPKENKERAFTLNKRVKELLKDSELAMSEIERFRFAAESDAGLIRMGVVPLETPAVMFKKFGPLAEYLTRQLGRRVDLKVAVDFAGAVKDIGQNVTQFCWMGPSTYTEAKTKYGARVLVKALHDGKPFHRAVIVTRQETGINMISDIKGKSFAFGDPHSTSSHIVPRSMLRDEGIDVNDLLYYNYLGHHDDVARAVLNGDFDAGAVMETTAHKFKDLGLKPVKFSGEIPEFNLCCGADVDAKLVARVKEIFLKLDVANPEHTSILRSVNESYTGFVEASDEDYQSVRNMMTRLGML